MDRLCIFCKHFYFTSGSPGYSEMTPGWEMDMECCMNHWRLDDFDTERTFRTKMQMAKNCKDYEYIPIEQI